eukprot:3215201-Rhodomonas_salina.1
MYQLKIVDPSIVQPSPPVQRGSVLVYRSGIASALRRRSIGSTSTTGTRFYYPGTTGNSECASRFSCFLCVPHHYQYVPTIAGVLHPSHYHFVPTAENLAQSDGRNS